MRVLIWIVLLWLGAVTAAPAQRLKPPLGSQVRVSASGDRSLSGELLAVDRDSIWLLQKQGLASVSLYEVSEVQVDRGGMGAKGALLWSLTFGLISGVALQTACSSVGGDCGRVLPTTLLLWGVVGGISAASLQSTRHTTVPAEPASLRPWARFPQGLPAGLAPDSLVGQRQD